MNKIEIEPVVYRDRIFEVPFLESMPDGVQGYSELLNSGLRDLVAEEGLEHAEYAGFMLDSYFFEDHTETLGVDFVDAFRETLSQSGLNTGELALSAGQSIFPSGDDCFDYIRLMESIWHRNITHMRHGGLGSFEESAFIMSPVVRKYTERRYDGTDEYNQRAHLVPNIASSVIMSGSVVLDAVRVNHPQIDIPLSNGELPDIYNATIAEALKGVFNLVEADNSYEDWQVDVFLKFGFGSIYSEDGMSVLPRETDRPAYLGLI